MPYIWVPKAHFLIDELLAQPIAGRFVDLPERNPL
jgi:hypothetical protein